MAGSDRLSKSPKIGSFKVESMMKRVEEGTKTIEEVNDLLKLYKTMDKQKQDLEQTEGWKINNMEYDLRSTEWICKKCRDSEVYAQNLYAAMCNNEFVKNDVWPLLQDKRWSCSWRYAGGIIANMRMEGDYIDWYCSGIRSNDYTSEELEKLTSEQLKYYNMTKLFVGESVVTDEIRQDLLDLGWKVIDDEEEII